MIRTSIGAVCLSLAALATGSSPALAKTLVYCSEGSPENFNPQINTTGTSFDAARPVYNQLVEFARGTVDVVPGLAEKWDVTENGTVVTFTLRKGVKFHAAKGFTPTRDFNADDVLFSFNRQWKDDHPFHKVSGGAYDYFNDMDSKQAPSAGAGHRFGPEPAATVALWRHAPSCRTAHMKLSPRQVVLNAIPVVDCRLLRTGDVKSR